MGGGRKSQGDALLPGLAGKAPALLKTGILPAQAYREFIRRGRIAAIAEIGEEQIQPASLDLRLGKVAFRVRASFLPGPKSSVQDKLDLLTMHKIDLAAGAVLERGCVYVVPLMEHLKLPAEFGGSANPKSTTGRLDIFTRLLTDRAAEFEKIRKGYKGPLYAEVSPRTFSVLVRPGVSLNQMRLARGEPPSTDKSIAELDRDLGLVYSDLETPGEAIIDRGLRISIDLAGGGRGELIGYRARHHAPLIDLSKIDFYDPAEFWEPIHPDSGRTLVLNPGDFYILASKELIRVPPAYAAEMVPYDAAVGEFRIHYAGFFDPGFGYGKADIAGTRAVLEVRSHEVPFLLEDGQIVGRLIYARLASVPDKIYGAGIGSSYQRQGLALSRQFKRG
ncbi:MAG: 2'-deoxycytidine 5'-triphosphate deaminase [Pseudomonadota bacterium]